jgi:hypothetical protein
LQVLQDERIEDGQNLSVILVVSIPSVPLTWNDVITDASTSASEEKQTRLVIETFTTFVKNDQELNRMGTISTTFFFLLAVTISAIQIIESKSIMGATISTTQFYLYGRKHFTQ